MKRPRKTMRPEKKVLYLRKRRKSIASSGLPGRGSSHHLPALYKYHHAKRDSTESYGDKGILHRLYQGVTGLFTDSEEETEESDVEEFMTFDRLGRKGIKESEKFFFCRDCMCRLIYRRGMS